jgi:hypothetical protein
MRRNQEIAQGQLRKTRHMTDRLQTARGFGTDNSGAR